MLNSPNAALARIKLVMYRLFRLRSIIESRRWGRRRTMESGCCCTMRQPTKLPAPGRCFLRRCKPEKAKERKSRVSTLHSTWKLYKLRRGSSRQLCRIRRNRVWMQLQQPTSLLFIIIVIVPQAPPFFFWYIWKPFLAQPQTFLFIANSCRRHSFFRF